MPAKGRWDLIRRLKVNLKRTRQARSFSLDQISLGTSGRMVKLPTGGRAVHCVAGLWLVPSEPVCTWATLKFADTQDETFDVCYALPWIAGALLGIGKFWVVFFCQLTTCQLCTMKSISTARRSDLQQKWRILVPPVACSCDVTSTEIRYRFTG